MDNWAAPKAWPKILIKYEILMFSFLIQSLGFYRRLFAFHIYFFNQNIFALSVKLPFENWINKKTFVFFIVIKDFMAKRSRLYLNNL